MLSIFFKKNFTLKNSKNNLKKNYFKIKTNILVMLKNKIIKDNISLIKSSLIITMVLNLISFLRYITKNKKIIKKTKKIPMKKNLPKIILKEFLFIFGQLSLTNLLIRFSTKKSKFSFLKGFFSTLIFVNLFKKKIPSTITTYILARIGLVYIKKLQIRGIIKKNVPIMKILFIFIVGILNFYVLNYPEYVSKKIYGNYKKFGSMNKKIILDFLVISKISKNKFDNSVESLEKEIS